MTAFGGRIVRRHARSNLPPGVIAALSGGAPAGAYRTGLKKTKAPTPQSVGAFSCMRAWQ